MHKNPFHVPEYKVKVFIALGIHNFVSCYKYYPFTRAISWMLQRRHLHASEVALVVKFGAYTVIFKNILYSKIVERIQVRKELKRWIQFEYGCKTMYSVDSIKRTVHLAFHGLFFLMCSIFIQIFWNYCWKQYAW